MWILLLTYWHYLVVALDILISAVASSHVILYKRDTRSVINWVGLIWLAPFIGAFLYYCLGINRIQRRAKILREKQWRPKNVVFSNLCTDQLLIQTLSPDGLHLFPLKGLINNLTQQPLLSQNAITPLFNGKEAYHKMIEAIRSAKVSVAFCTYIFDNDHIGQRFVEVLEEATKRGVEVRILVDAMGLRYSYPSIFRTLKKKGLPTAKFIPTFLPRSMHYANLRNHRKILVVDGNLGFTGGMNIRAGTEEKDSKHSILDLHFRLEGPVVAELQETFVTDWAFTTGEFLDGEKWFPPLEPKGNILARGIPDGPDEDFDKLHLTLLGALSVAQKNVWIVTPYFLPDAALIATLNITAMRGVDVNIIIPEQNNLKIVQWASSAILWQVLEHKCKVWLSPPPFDHTKLMLVDGFWSFFGSANWDARSLRLNFEFNVCCYDRNLAKKLEEWVQAKARRARQTSLEEVDRRRFPIRLRDGIARLFSPYL